MIGFIGLGQLGSRLATLLVEADHNVMVFDTSEPSLQTLVERGARGAKSPAEIGQHCETVLTCLPSPVASESVMTGDGGVLSTLAPGSTWIETSTTSVDEILRMAGIAESHGIHLLEAPMTGGVHRAARGEMTILAGGPEDLFEDHLSLLQTIGGEVIYLGKTGNASLVKVISNLLCLVDLVAAGEALMLAKKGGIDLARCYEAICASSGTSREFEDWVPQVLNGSLNTGFTTDLCLKDLGFAAAMGQEHGVPLRVTTLVKELFEQSRSRYGGDAWTPHVIKMLEEEAGVELRAEGFPDVING